MLYSRSCSLVPSRRKRPEECGGIPLVGCSQRLERAGLNAFLPALLLGHRFGQTEQNRRKIWNGGKLAFVDQVVWLGPRIRFTFLTLILKLSTASCNFYVKAIITDHSYHLAICVETEFSKHWLG